MPHRPPHPSRKASSTKQKKSSLPHERSRTSGAVADKPPRPRSSSRGGAPERSNRKSDRIHPIPAVAVVARAPIPGKTKTRLIPALGEEGAAELHRAMVSDALVKVSKLKVEAARYLFAAGGKIPQEMVPGSFQVRRQTGQDLGQRLERAFTQLLRQHSRAVVIGTDSPALAPSMLRLALEELCATDAVLGPCPDGGYYLIGLRRSVPGLFSGARLGTEFAMQDTLDNLLTHGFLCSVLEPCPDIDRPGDLVALKKSLVNKPAARRLMPQTWRFLSGMA